jgi:hypothetical protein
MLVVDDMMYGIDPSDGAWVELGPTDSIDPACGVRECQATEAGEGRRGGGERARTDGPGGGIGIDVTPPPSRGVRGRGPGPPGRPPPPPGWAVTR